MTKHEAPDIARRRFFEAALDLWAERGFHNVSINQIAARAERSKGSFYHHFASKQELLLALVTDFVGTVEGDIAEGMQEASSATELLRGLMMQYSTYFESDPRMMPVFLEFCSISVRDEDVRDLFAGRYQQAVDALEQIFAWGVSTGEFRSDLDTALLARTFTYASDGLALVHLVAGTKDGALGGTFNLLCEVFIRGISAPTE